MKTRLAKLLRLLGTPCGLAGAFFGATLAGLAPGGVGLLGLVVGWLYGIVVGALIRLFRVPAGAYPLIGLLCGPVPIALLTGRGASQDERGALALGLVGGLVLGLVEWASTRHHGQPAVKEASEAAFLAPGPPAP